MPKVRASSATFGAPASCRQIAAERIAARAKIAKLGAVFRWLIEFESGRLFVGERKGEPVAEGDERLDVELLGLMRGHAGFPRAAHSVAFLGLGEDDGWPFLARARRCESGEKLAEIVAATFESVDVSIRHVCDQRMHFRVFVKEVNEVVAAVSSAQRLILAVDGGGETAKQRVLFIAREECVPFGAQKDLDDVPTRAAEKALQLRNNLAVSAHRPVEALKVAVDDEGQIV